ncbi:hypothetical protein ACFQMB_03415 [Pseudobowmanella zhangzhouensis]|uniref:hypothetical protein n=1 Tax=Pseudobowmanella zhangzhouensis TaxID=1537679 RepID=UPI00360652CD
MVSWFKEQFGLAETLRADDADMPVEALFDELVDKVPPGAMGLMLQPYWGREFASRGRKPKVQLLALAIFTSANTCTARFWKALISA